MIDRIKALILKTGGPCNNHCFFCAEEGASHETDFEALREKIASSSPRCAQVVFTGKEPTMHPRITDLLKAAKDANYRVITVVTNGRMFAYGKFARDMALAGMTDMMVALHSGTAEVHDRITGVEGSFEQTVRGIRNARRVSDSMRPYNDVSITGGAVVVESNHQLLNRVVDLALSLGLDGLFFVREKTRKDGLDFEKTRPFLTRALEHARREGLTVFTKGYSEEEMGPLKDFRYEDFMAREPVIAPET